MPATLFWFTFPQARLVIVAGPAFPISTLFSNFTAILLFTGPACHCGRSRRVPPPPSLHHPILAPRPGLSLWQVPPSSPPLFNPSNFLSYLVYSRLSSTPPVSPLATPRAPAAMGDPKWSCWRSATTNPQVILLATCSSTTTSWLSLESLAVPHSPEREVLWLDMAWLCFALAGHWRFMESYFVTVELFHDAELNWVDSERTLRTLRRPPLFHALRTKTSGG